MTGKTLICALALVVAGCGSTSASAPHSATTLSPAQATPSPSASSTPSPSPSPSPTPGATPKAAAAAAQSIPVSFPGLSRGAYPTHLHSACNGSQSYHILVLQTLVVGGDGAGTIQVPSAYFGRSLCIIVYTSPSLTRVYTTRRI